MHTHTHMHIYETQRDVSWYISGFDLGLWLLVHRSILGTGANQEAPMCSTMGLKRCFTPWFTGSWISCNAMTNRRQRRMASQKGPTRPDWASKRQNGRGVWQIMKGCWNCQAKIVVSIKIFQILDLVVQNSTGMQWKGRAYSDDVVLSGATPWPTPKSTKYLTFCLSKMLLPHINSPKYIIITILAKYITIPVLDSQGYIYIYILQRLILYHGVDEVSQGMTLVSRKRGRWELGFNCTVHPSRRDSKQVL